MLWRNRSWLARLAVAATVLALALASLTVITVMLPDGQASYAAFVYSLFAAFAATCLWGLVALQLGLRGLRRRD